MFNREEILNRPTYHLTGIGVDIFCALIPHLYEGVELPPIGEPLPSVPPHRIYELAEKCEVPVHTIQLMANGDFNGSLTKLVKVCTALGIAPSVHFQKVKK